MNTTLSPSVTYIPRPIVSLHDQVISRHNRGQSVTYHVGHNFVSYLVEYDGIEFIVSVFDDGNIGVQSV